MNSDQNCEPTITPKNNRLAFVIRIWIEPREIAGAAAQWRGVINHAYTGDERYLKELDDIIDFIEPYLTDMGIKPSRPQGPDHDSAAGQDR